MVSTTTQPIDLTDLLAFYAEAGVDEAMSDTPIDRFAATAAEKVTPLSGAERPAAGQPADPSTTAGRTSCGATRLPSARRAIPPAFPPAKRRRAGRRTGRIGPRTGSFSGDAG